MPSRLAAAALLATSALLLSGCVPPGPEVVPPPESTSSPLFASDEEALAAATDAYEAYLKMSDLIAQEGGANPERIAPFATGDAIEAALDGYKVFREQRYKSTGNSQIAGAILQRYSHTESQDVAAIYACLDLSGVDVVDESGNSVVATGRPDRQQFEVTFDTVQDVPGKLIVASRDPWTGSTVCGN